MKKYIFILLIFSFLNYNDLLGFTSPGEIKPSKASGVAIKNFLDTFEKAFFEEDIDLLGSIISPDITGKEKEDFLAPFENLFSQYNFISFKLDKRKINFGKNDIEVSAKIIQTAEDIGNAINGTQTYDISFKIGRKITANGVIIFSLASYEEKLNTIVIRNEGIRKDSKSSEIKVFSSDSNGASNILSAEVNFLGSKDWIKLENEVTEYIHFIAKKPILLKGLKGSFKAPSLAGIHIINIRTKIIDGKTIIISHTFRVSDKEIESVETGNADVSFGASAKDKNGTLWFGGDGGGKVFRSDNGETFNEVFNLAECLPAKNLPDNTRIEDIIFDSLNRGHLIFYGREENEKYAREVGGDVVFNAIKENIKCADISLLIDFDNTEYITYLEWKGDEVYPFYRFDNKLKEMLPSPFNRALPADDGSIWLLGSDGGVANFSDSRDGRYNPVFSRRLGSINNISSNTVPTATIDMKGNVWFGTVLGVNRYGINKGKISLFTYVPDRKFDASKLDTLEEYFNEIVSLIQSNKNLSSGLGDINFKETFGIDLVKEDFIWSSAIDNSGRLWFGTLGGGIRVFENGKERKDMHLTKQNGLISNIILSMAVDDNNDIWVGTEQGVSVIKGKGARGQKAKVKIQNFSELDGLGNGPVLDITPDDNGNIWFVTDKGIFKYTLDN